MQNIPEKRGTGRDHGHGGKLLKHNAYSAGIDYRGKGFLDTAFDAEEQKALIRTRVENRPNRPYGTDSGNDTEDFLFLLSNDEVFSSDTAVRNGFFASNDYDDPAKRFRSTMYAKCMVQKDPPGDSVFDRLTDAYGCAWGTSVLVASGLRRSCSSSAVSAFFVFSEMVAFSCGI